MNLLTERNQKVFKPLTQKTMAEEMKSFQPSVNAKPGNRLPLASLDSHQDLFTPSLQFQGAKSIPTSKASLKGPSGFERLAHFKLPVAMLGVFGSGLGNLAMAAVTPESEKLVKTLDSKDENLVETALVNLGNINERDALPFVKKILSEAKASEDTLNAAMKAAGLLGAKSNEAEKAELSKLIMPYLQKVVLQDKDKNNTFLFFDQIQPEMIDKDTKVKDVGFAAAKALGQIGHGATVSQLSKAAQDPSLGKDVRYLALEAIKNSPANPAIDKEMIALLDKLDPASEGPLVAQVLQVIVKHNVSDGWNKIEKMFEEKVATPAPTTPAPGTPNNQAPSPTPKETKSSSTRKGIAPQQGEFRTRNTDGPTPIQSAAIQAVLSQKKPESAALVMKQMAKYPDFFRRMMPQMVEYVKAMPLETKKELLSWVDAGASEKAASAANPKKSYYATPDDERKDEQKVRMNGMKLRQMAVVLTALAKVPNAGAEYQKIYTNSFENPGFRSLAVAATTFVKDASAIPSLMALGADDTEDVDLRYDAIAGSMEILVPPPAKGLESNIDRANFMERYLTTFSENEQFTKSFFKAEMFNEIREVRKALIKANAPLKDLDEATLKIVDKRIKTMGLSSEMKKALLASPQAKDIERKMLDYVSKKQNADGFLRIMMVGALGQMESKDAKAVMKELVSDPLVRTKIPDVASSNDMMMFPGYTKQTIASNTRLAAVQSMGKTGTMDEAEFLEKALRSDDRRLHMTALSSIEEIGQRTGTNGNPLVDPNPAVEARRAALADRMLRAMPKVNMNASARMDNHVKKLYAQAIDKLGGGEKLLALMDKTSDTVLKRAIANGLIKNDKYLDNPKVSQHLLAMSLGVDQLHKMGIDGRGTEIAILDGDYLNDDIPGVEGKVVYPEWGNLKEASLRTSFHDEAVASAMVGRRANVTYGIAPGVDKIYSYAAWDDNLKADRNAPVEEVDGMLRAIDDIIAKKISGKTKVSVVNMSLGGSSALQYADEEGLKTYMDKFSSRIEAASKAGITFVISAGNEGGRPMRHHLIGTLNLLGFNKKNGKLAETNGLILVGATDTQGSTDRSKHTISFFSSVGDAFNPSEPHIVAPGTNIPLLNREDNGDINIDEMDGTSFSAPITAATILLMNQAAGKPLETQQIKEIFAKTAYQLEDVPKSQQGPGGLDPLRAVEAAKNLKVGRDFGNFLDSMGTLLKLKEQNPPQPAAPVNK